jgi:prepilin-type N-terminal cleavage/methylation domain-containing protein
MTREHRLVASNHGQRGFTLVELVMAMSVTALIMLAATLVLYQVITNNYRTAARMTAVKQVENVVHFMVRDVQMADPSSIQMNLSPTVVLRLQWVDWDSKLHTVEYSIVNGNLERQYDVGAQTAVARYIASIVPAVDATSGEVVVTITSKTQGRWGATESRIIRVKPRIGF